jgi:hypothetical protein
MEISSETGDCEKIYANLKERKGGNEGNRVRGEGNRLPY